MFCVDERCLALDELLTHPIRAAHMSFRPLRLLSTVLRDLVQGRHPEGATRSTTACTGDKHWAAKPCTYPLTVHNLISRSFYV